MTKIEWVQRTWNPIAGCSKVSDGCKNCYAIRDAWRLAHNPDPAIAAKYQGLTAKTRDGINWTGALRLWEPALTQPLAVKTPTSWFVNSMSDLWHDGLSDDDIDRVFAVMALCPQHQFLVLTKRPARMRAYFERLLRDDPALDGIGCWHVAGAPVLGDAVSDEDWVSLLEATDVPLPNVWLGVSVEDQRRADERIPHLLATPAAVRFLSCEPLLGPVDLEAIGRTSSEGFMRPLDGRFNRINWVIAGGESGHAARPCHPDWVCSVRDQCVRAGVPFFFKQWGAYRPGSDFATDDSVVCVDRAGRIAAGCLRQNFPRGASSGDGWTAMRRVGKKRAGRTLDGRTWEQLPQ